MRPHINPLNIPNPPPGQSIREPIEIPTTIDFNGDEEEEEEGEEGGEKLSPESRAYEEQLFQAVKNRNFDRVQQIVNLTTKAGIPLNIDRAVEESIRNFSIHTLIYLLRNTPNPPPLRYVLATAATTRGRGQRYLLDYLFRLNPTLSDIGFAAETAAEHPEDNAITHLLIGRGARNFGLLLASAVRSNNIELIHYLLTRPLTNEDLKRAINLAILLCHPRILPLLLEKTDFTEREYQLLYLSALESQNNRAIMETAARLRNQYRESYLSQCDDVVRILKEYLSEESLNLFRPENLQTPPASLAETPLRAPSFPFNRRRLPVANEGEGEEEEEEEMAATPSLPPVISGGGLRFGEMGPGSQPIARRLDFTGL